jgi:DNA-binding NarL/FixJ family response regulator
MQQEPAKTKNVVGEKTKVLIVEDESLISYGYKLQLERSGFEVVDRVRNAMDAETSMLHIKPDIILMDIYIRGSKNGLDLAKEIHGREPIPILFVTASTKPDIIQEISKLKGCRFIPKPVNTELLERVLLQMKAAAGV